MAHRHDVYRYGPDDKYIEHEYKCKGKFGAKGESRAPKKKATPEQIMRQNHWKKEKLILRLLRANFSNEDLWVTLKFPAGTKLSKKEILAIRKKFFDKLRREYKKAGEVLKYIYRIEIGKNGGPHFHAVVNRVNSFNTAKVIEDIWSEFGQYLNYTPLYEAGEYSALAYYICKPINEEIEGQLTLWGTEEDKKLFMTYNRSRNLIIPEAEEKEYKRRTIRKLVEEGPTPAEGYYIDPDSVCYGTNPFNGMTYYYYTEIKHPDKHRWKEDGNEGSKHLHSFRNKEPAETGRHGWLLPRMLHAGE